MVWQTAREEEVGSDGRRFRDLVEPIKRPIYDMSGGEADG